MKTAIVYSQPTCGPCNMIKEMLKGEGVTVEVRDVIIHPEYMEELNALGYKSTPVTVIDGIEIVGFNPPAIQEALNK